MFDVACRRRARNGDYGLQNGYYVIIPRMRQNADARTVGYILIEHRQINIKTEV